MRLRSHTREYESGTVWVLRIQVQANMSLCVFQWWLFTYIRVWVTCKFHSYE